MKRVRRIALRILAAIAAITVAFALVLLGGRAVNYVRRSAACEEYSDTYVELGGVQQYVSVRGNPDGELLLWVHGGPGSPLSPVAYTFCAPLEQDYLVVHWDQRGSGRSWFEDSAAVSPSQLLGDLAGLVEWLCESYTRQSVTLVGYSFGTALCLQYAAAHPERVTAYIAVSQVTDLVQSVSLSAGRALAHPDVTDADATALREGLDTLLGDSEDPAAHIQAYQRLQSLCGRYFPAGKGAAGNLFWAGAFSPDCGLRDMAWKVLQMTPTYFATYGKAMQWLFLEFRADTVRALEMPVLFISGEHDYVTPPDTVAAYAASLGAPSVEHVILKDCAHSPFFDDPAAFAACVRDFVR